MVSDRFVDAVDVARNVPPGFGAGEETGPPDAFGFWRHEKRLERPGEDMPEIRN
jgi:hypothetical protein